MAPPPPEPEATKPVSAARPAALVELAAVQPIAAMKPNVPIPPVRESAPPTQRIIPAAPAPRLRVAPAVAVPQVPAPRELPLALAGELRPVPLPPQGARPHKLLAPVAVALAVVAASIWLGLSLSRAGRRHPATASPQLTQVGQLISQADADAARFQRTELTPDQATASLQTRTAQYQEAQRLCRAAPPLGADRATALSDQQAAARGLHQVQADTEAQSARLLTAEIGASIALYKRQTLTDAQAARIRAKLRTDSNAALSDCADALKDDPANAVAWAARVQALRFLGEPKAAAAALARALTLAPGSPILVAQGGAPE